MVSEVKLLQPRLRFVDFHDDWTQQRIGSILTDISRPVQLLDNELYQLVTVKRRNEGVVPRSVVKGKNILVKNYFAIKAGDFLISKRQVVHGANGIVPESLDNAVVSNEYLVVTDNQKITAKFWSTISKRPEIKKLYFISSYGVDIEKLVFDITDWKERYILIPELNEQQKITDFFQNLDQKIELHQDKHRKLQQLKKAMLDKMFPRAGKKVPELRFAGFDSDWETKDFQEIFIYIRNNSLSRAELNDDAGLGMNVHYGDVLVKFGEILDFTLEKVPFITNGGAVEKMMPNRLQDGDIVFADAAEDLTVGKCCEINKLGSQPLFAGLHTIAVRPKKAFAPKYLGYFLNSNLYHDQLLTLIQGTKVSSISKSSIKETQVYYPKDAAEQAKIGEYFHNLERLIVIQQQKINKLKNIKQACLGKMFV
ncbi:restriction endonuclease subunit S [Vibrio parahaemolyticus]